MIKVLHILQDINSGGVERRRLSIAKRINTSEFELKIICINAKNDIPELIRNCGVEVIELKTYSGPFDWSAHKKVQKIISDYKPDIIHGAVFEGVTLAAINGFIKRVPHVIIEETSDPVYRSWRGNLLMKIFGTLSHYSIGVSHAAYSYLKDTLKLPKRKVQLIVNGVKSANLYPEHELEQLKIDLGIKPSDFVFISAGRMHAELPKRFRVLLQTFAQVALKHSNAKLILIGDGEMLEQYKKLVKDLKIDQQVIFTGYQGQVDKYMAISNVFCMFSNFESFGLASVEAQMNKLPAIVTNVGGLKYTVVNNETGFIIDVDDFEQMSEKMEFCLLNPNKTKAMGARAYDYVNANFHEDLYTSNLFNFYKKIIAE